MSATRELDCRSRWSGATAHLHAGVALAAVAIGFASTAQPELDQVAWLAGCGRSASAEPGSRVTDAEVVVENPAHDFPQRIAYAREGESKLRARIEGMRDGALRVIEFPLSRVSCDSQA